MCEERADITSENGLQWDFGHVRKMEKFQTWVCREKVNGLEQRFRCYQERVLCAWQM